MEQRWAKRALHGDWWASLAFHCYRLHPSMSNSVCVCL